MESREPTDRSPRRDDTASLTRIVITLGGIVVGVALLGWAVFAVAGLLIPAAPSAPATATPPTSTSSAKTTTSSAPVKTDSAIPSEPDTTVAKAAPAPPPAVTPPPAAASKPAAKSSAPAPAPTSANSRYIVVIDPGHQAQANLALEPIGPGSSTKRPKVEGGASGVVTHRPESLDNLQIALAIRKALVAQGVTVYMVRTTQNVNIPNSQRAAFANAHHANLFLRVHCDSGPSGMTGFLTLVPGRDKWTGPIVAASARAGKDVQAAAVAATGANSRGISQRTDLSGFNWSKVPAVLVECGMMSNPGEDRKLASSSYQDKLAAGISAGVLRYLHGN